MQGKVCDKEGSVQVSYNTGALVCTRMCEPCVYAIILDSLKEALVFSILVSEVALNGWVTCLVLTLNWYLYAHVIHMRILFIHINYSIYIGCTMYGVLNHIVNCYKCH